MAHQSTGKETWLSLGVVLADVLPSSSNSNHLICVNGLNTINQPINQSINQPINQSTIRSPINQYIINNYSYPSPFIIRNTEEETTNTSKDSFFLCYFDLPATLFDLHFVAANLSGTGTYHTKALQNTSVVRIHGLPPKAQQKVDG